MEISLFIDEAALTKLQPGMSLDESGFLGAFDANRDLICAAAAKFYVRGTKRLMRSCGQKFPRSHWSAVRPFS
jgi:hypothetical protein